MTISSLTNQQNEMISHETTICRQRRRMATNSKQTRRSQVLGEASTKLERQDMLLMTFGQHQHDHNICSRVPPMVLHLHEATRRQNVRELEMAHGFQPNNAATCSDSTTSCQRNTVHRQQTVRQMTKVRSTTTRPATADKCLCRPKRQITPTLMSGPMTTNCCCRSDRHSRSIKTMTAASTTSVLLLACLSVVLMPPLAQVKYCTTQGAVIRPTIFSDLPPDTPTSSGQPVAAASVPSAAPSAIAVATAAASAVQQNNQQQAAQAQQTSMQQATVQQSATQFSSNSHYLNNHPNWHHGNSHQADSPPAQPTQKITPLKSRFCTNANGQRIDHSLGLQSMAIDDLSLTASSFSNEQVRPHLARLNLDILGGAWCPMKPISSSNFGKEWIQVKLNRSFVISAIETQGRFAMGSGKEFVPSYQVEYSRNNGITWLKWKDFRGSSLLRANEDVQSTVRNELSPPIVGANVIRLLPYSQHLRTVCLRFELFGCQYDEGAPISYTTHDGVVEPRWGHLIDYTYDGQRHRNGQLSGGLGQLVDGVKGPDNFQFNNGFEWVGWKSMNGDVVIEFTFKTLRNFTGALFYSNNLFSSGVEVFQAVDVHYGIDVHQSLEALRDSLYEQRRRLTTNLQDGQLMRSSRQLGFTDSSQEALANVAASSQTVWSSDVLSIEYEPDKKAESSRPVTVHLKQRLANKLRFVLKFASKWILLSEVEFLSHPVELMSLASLNEQLTPKLMLDLQQAKTYDQYVAILREHQLRRIAADEYLQMGALGIVSSTTSSSLGDDPTSSSTPTNGHLQDQQQAEQVGSESTTSLNYDQQQQTSQDDTTAATYNFQAQLLAKRLITPPWSPIQTTNQEPQSPISWSQTQFMGNPLAPATNPLLTVQPMDPNLFDLKSPTTSNTSANGNLLEQPKRSIGLATVISFVFVAIIAFLGSLFAYSSYKLRNQVQSKLANSPGSGLPRHLVAVQNKNFMSNVFASTTPVDVNQQLQQNSASSTSSGELVSGNGTMQYATQQQAHQHHNPLFANSSGRSSANSLRKPSSGGALSTLKRLAALTSGSATNNKQQQRAANTNLMFTPSNQNQLLVSLKDSKIQTGTTTTSTGNQLIVGLNQINPLAHQQIYSQQLYGQQQQTNYSANTNSISLASSSTSGANGMGDYATPDIQQPIISRHFGMGDQFRNSSRHFGAPVSRQMLLASEHNYEQISSSGQEQTNIATSNRPAFPVSTMMLHNRTFSNQQQEQANNCQQFNTLNTASGRSQLNRLTSAQVQQDQSSSHYYYADTEAAKCLR